MSNPLPITASFIATPVSGVGPLAVTFTDTSTGNPDTWKWSLGLETQTTKNAYFVYPPVNAVNDPPQNYTVTLEVSNSGFFNSCSQTITVFPPPSAGDTLAIVIGVILSIFVIAFILFGLAKSGYWVSGRFLLLWV